MANFATALAWTLDNWEDPTHEYKITPDAPPGAFAIAGVNSVENPVAYNLIAAAEQDERAPLVANFYQNVFWNQWLEQLTSDDLAKRVFDAAVNMGSGTAVKLLQDAVNTIILPLDGAKSFVVDDGQWGPQTLHGVRLCCDPSDSPLVRAFQNARADHYRAIVAAQPQDAKYLTGWLTRALK
jgi:hypothetical protein